MMRFPVSFTASLAVAALAVCAAVGLPAQESSSQTQTPPASAQTAQPAYVVIDPLAGVRYDNRWDVSLEMAYDHMKAGPTALQGANLGGVNLSGSYYLARRWRLEGTFRPYVGTSGVGQVNPYDISGPFVAQYLFAAGPEWLGPHNKHGALIAHVLVGGAYGDFQHDLRGHSPEVVGFYNNQVAPAVIMGGHFDLNRSAHWVLRLSPDAVMTDYGVNYGKKYHQIDINAAFSVGVEYRFLRKKK
jgi:hypothetical protein